MALGVTPCGIVESWAEKPVYRYLRPMLSSVAQLGLETQPALEKSPCCNRIVSLRRVFATEDIVPVMAKIAPVTLLDDVFEFKKR